MTNADEVTISVIVKNIEWVRIWIKGVITKHTEETNIFDACDPGNNIKKKKSHPS